MKRLALLAAFAIAAGLSANAKPIDFELPPDTVEFKPGPNLEVVHKIIQYTGQDESLIEYVTDRPGHDRHYSLASEKARGLGWEAQVRFAEGLERTVGWYRENR